MSAIDDSEYANITSHSPIAPKYAHPIDRDSAHEILQRKIAASADVAEPAPPSRNVPIREPQPLEPPRSQYPSTRGGRKEDKGVIGEMMNSRIAQNVGRQVARTVTQQVMRGIFGMLKGK